MEHFEVQYLRSVSDYHTTGRIFLLEDTLLTNLERFYDSWYLESAAVGRCLITPLKAWFASMLKDYWWDIYAECEELLGVNNEGHLTLICMVVGEFGGEEETEQLRAILATHVRRNALAVVSRIRGGDMTSPDPVTCATALLEVEQEANELWTRLQLSLRIMERLKLKQETGTTRKVIEEIIDEHPGWRDAMDKLRSSREIILEPDSKGMNFPGTLKVTDEAVSSLDLRKDFC
jgi:hypothetical protein